MSSISDLLTKLENATPDNAPFLVRELLQDQNLLQLRQLDALRAARAIATFAGPQQLAIAGELAGRAHQDSVAGAGALFASGCLHGQINNLSLKESLQKGTEMSSKIIQKIGARLS